MAREDGADGGDRVLAAVIENVAREVGLAVLELGPAPRLSLLQLVEHSRQYPVISSHLQCCSPAAVVVCSSAQSDAMLGVSAHVGLSHELASMPRSCFDDTKAAVRLEALADAASAELLSSSTVKHSLYLALGAAGGQHACPAQDKASHHSRLHVRTGALLLYAEEQRATSLLHNALQVEHVLLSDRVALDSATAAALELVRPSSSTTGRPKRSCSLFAWLNYTVTAAGARLLKARACGQQLAAGLPLMTLPDLTMARPTFCSHHAALQRLSSASTPSLSWRTAKRCWTTSRAPSRAAPRMLTRPAEGLHLLPACSHAHCRSAPRACSG